MLFDKERHIRLYLSIFSEELTKESISKGFESQHLPSLSSRDRDV